MDYNNFGKNDLLTKNYLLASLGKNNLFNRQIFTDLKLNLIVNNNADKSFNNAKNRLYRKSRTGL